MTEEEKKAIEDLKEEIKSLEKAKIEFSNEIEDKGWLQKNINELDKDIFYKNTLLNLIEKQVKETEEKDKIIAEYNKRGQTLNNLINAKDTIMYKEICKNFIPKDKIRELFEKYNINISEEEITADGLDALSFIEEIDELLEEE